MGRVRGKARWTQRLRGCRCCCCCCCYRVQIHCISLFVLVIFYLFFLFRVTIAPLFQSTPRPYSVGCVYVFSFRYGERDIPIQDFYFLPRKDYSFYFLRDDFVHRRDYGPTKCSTKVFLNVRLIKLSLR